MGRPEKKKPLARLKRRWEDNIKIDLQEVAWGGGMDWVDLTQDRDMWQALLHAVMNILVP